MAIRGGLGDVEKLLGLGARLVIRAAAVSVAFLALLCPKPVALGAFVLGEHVASLGAPRFRETALPATK